MTFNSAWLLAPRSLLTASLFTLAASSGLNLAAADPVVALRQSDEEIWVEASFTELPLTVDRAPQTGLKMTQVQLPPPPDSLQPQIEPPSQEPIEEPDAPELLPAPEDLLDPGLPVPDAPDPIPGEVPATVRVSRFEIVGSTVFSEAELAEVTERYTNIPLSFNQLFEVRSALTRLYADRGYVTSAAVIPPQTFRDQGVVRIEVVEGSLEAIRVIGTQRLDSDYVSERIERYTGAPLQTDRLLEGLQLLQLDPLIQQVSADLSAGPRPGTSLLTLQVTEAPTFQVDLTMDNGRSPTVGTFQHQIDITEANLLGNGEQLSVGYDHTSGVDAFDVSYTYFLNARNGTLEFSAGFTDSNVVEDPFSLLDIDSTSTFLEATWRQPLVRTPTEEFAIGFTASRQESRSVFLGNLLGDAIPFPAIGANNNGRTRVTAFRFFQDWVKQGPRQVLAARSQFSVGLDFLGATSGDIGPNSEFFSWRGQGQWVRLLAPETLLIVQSDVQLADSDLVPLEQISMGGAGSIRGYRQDLLLTSNGARVSAELRWPIYRSPDLGLIQLTPFVDIGAGWNNSSSNPDPNVLASLGLGVLWQVNDRITARIDYGIPLVTSSDGDSLQENGLHLSLSYTPFKF